MNRVCLLLCALLLPAAGAAGQAAAATARPALHAGTTGQRVKDLQWLLSGYRPSVYQFSTYSGRVDGRFGPLTRVAVRRMKYRLGYPARLVDGRAGRQLFEFLLGKRARPLGWVGRASARATRPNVHPDLSTPCAARIVRVARSQLGVHEIPDGSNDGLRVRVFQRVTGAFRAPWCASFVQWVFGTAGVGTIANRSAGVFYIVDWAHTHLMLHARPRVGAAVAYMRNLGHIGIVESLFGRDGFVAIEGNASNRVKRVIRHVGDQRTVFVWAPCPEKPG